jgi:hypothetical protein
MNKPWVGRLRAATLCLVLGLPVSQAVALQTDIDWLQVNGFLSQSVLSSTDNNYLGKTDDDLSFDFREAGLAAAIQPLPNLRLSTQLLSRRAGANADGSVEIDHAVISYNFIENADWMLGVRAGRLKSVLGWYNETRDVPFTRPGVFLPFSVYAEIVRDSYFFQDGAMLRGEWRQNLDALTWHVGYHEPRVDRDEIVDIAPMPNGVIPDAEGRGSLDASLIYEIDGGRARFGLFYQENRIDIGLDGDLSVGPFSLPDFDGNVALVIRKTVASFEYNVDKWSFITEYGAARIRARISSRNPTLGPIVSQLRQRMTSPSYYYQLHYRASESWDFFVRYDRFAFDDHDMYGSRIAASPSFNFRGLPDFAFYASTYSVGAGYHINTSWLLRAEWHNVEGGGWLNHADNEDHALKKYWDLLAVQLSYRF